MNERDEVPVDWQLADDTLDDTSCEQVPAGSQQWLAGQRFVHGLLRAMHTADSSAREVRVQNLLHSIDAERSISVHQGRRHWGLVAAAALLLAAVAAFFALPDRLPTAQAAVQRAVEQLARDVDLRFLLVLTGEDVSGQEKLRHEFDLVTRPGLRFLVDGKLSFGPVQLGEFQIGSDGEEFWMKSANGMLRRASPIAEHERLMQGLGDLVDVGYLDVHALVRQLPEDFELEVVGHETGAQGQRLLRIEAKRERRGRRGGILHDAWLLCDEVTGMVTHLQVQAQMARGFRRGLTFDLVGEVPPGTIDYRKPW